MCCYNNKPSVPSVQKWGTKSKGEAFDRSLLAHNLAESGNCCQVSMLSFARFQCLKKKKGLQYCHPTNTSQGYSVLFGCTNRTETSFETVKGMLFIFTKTSIKWGWHGCAVGSAVA